MNNLNSMHQNHDQFDPSSSHDEFLEQLLSSVPSSFPWTADDNSATLLADQSTSKITSASAKALMLQHQLFLPHNDVVTAQENDESSKALFNGFTGLLGQTPHPSQSENFGLAAVSQPRQKVRARRGQATDPHSIAERLRRERIAERMKSLQEMVPNANKTDKASMLDEIIDYVKFLQLQVKVLSMSRLGGAAAVAPLLGDTSSQGNGGNGAESAASSSQNDDGMTTAEQRVAKLMSDDMGAAMQYLQGKGLCLMPISLATAISTTTARSSGEVGAPTSPSMSLLTVQSRDGELSTSISKS